MGAEPENVNDGIKVVTQHYFTPEPPINQGTDSLSCSLNISSED